MASIGIKEIASRAKVSPATVSRVLSNPELVSQKTRNKVKKIIDETGYRPNRLGASLRTRKTGNIFAIIPDISKPVNAGIVRAIENRAHSFGYSVLLGDTQGMHERGLQYAELVKMGQADGILLFSGDLPFDVNNDKPLYEQIPPLVNANERVDTDGLVQIAVDNVAAAKDAMQHLLELGHTRIAAVTGPMNVPSSCERFNGYKLALENAGLTYDPKLVVNGDYSVNSGEDAVDQLMLLRLRPTAVFCFNDDMAIGLMKKLQTHGYDIPADISVIGFDDIRYAKYTTPALTTVYQPMEEIGLACIDALLDQLKGNTPTPRCDFLPHSLEIRESTGPAPE